MRLFLDANVLFTAMHNPRGKAALVIELGYLGHWELYSSLYALASTRLLVIPAKAGIQTEKQ